MKDNKKPVILLDIDRTIFDTDSFSQTTVKIMAKMIGCRPDKIEAQKDKYVSSLETILDFDPEKYLDHLSLAFSFSKEKLRKKFFEDETIYLKSLYTDTISTLKTLSRNYLLGIYSEGNFPFQMTKITKSGIIRHLHKKHLVIVPRKLEGSVLALLPTGAIIVDDKITIVEKLSETKAVIPIWINRSSNLKHPQIKTIFQLSELPKMIKELSKS